MRVALDGTPLLGSRTGVATFTEGLLRALAARDDLDVVAFALSLRGWRRLRDVVPAGTAVRARPLPAAAFTRLWASSDRGTAELLVGRNLDVVHGTNYAVPPTARAGAVVTVYDLTAVRFPEMVEPASLRYPNLVTRAVRRGALVHVTAKAIAAEAEELLGVPAERVRVVASGVDVPSEPGDAARGLRLAGGRPYVLALGTIEPRKGFPDLVAAFGRIADEHRDLVLVFAGPDGWGTTDLVAAIDASPHRRRIRRLGWVHEHDRRHLLAGASVFAMPSRYEGFGYPPLEAMAAGTPVVTTTAGSLPEVVGDAGVLVEAGDVDALAEAIARVVVDDATRQRLRVAGRVRVREFAWSDCARGMVDVYRDAAAA